MHNTRNSIEPNSKNLQKLDYDLWHHATLVSYFKALKNHQTELPISFIKLRGTIFSVDAECFTELIDILDKIPVRLKRTLTDQVRFKLVELDDETFRLSFTSTFGYYLQTLLTLSSEDEIQQNVETLLSIRKQIDQLSTKLNASDKHARLYGGFSTAIANIPDNVRMHSVDVVTEQSTADSTQTGSGPATEQSTADNAQAESESTTEQTADNAQTETESATEQTADNAQAESESTTEQTVNDVQAESESATEQTADNVQTESESTTEQTANDTQAESKPVTEQTANDAQATEQAVNDTQAETAADDDDSEFKSLYDDSDDTNISNDNHTTAATDTNTKQVLDAVENNHDGDIIDDSPIDFNEPLSQISSMISNAVNSPTSNATAPKNPLDEFYQQQDQTLAANLDALN